MSQYLSEDLAVELEHEQAFDAARVQGNLAADDADETRATDDRVEGRNADAAAYLEADENDYARTLQEAPTPVDDYLALGATNDPATTFENALSAIETRAFADEAAESAAAETGDQAALDAANAAQAAAVGAPSVSLPPETPQAEAAARGYLLYANGSFQNGAIGGVARAAAGEEYAAQNQGLYPVDDPVVAPADPVGDVGPVPDGDGRAKQSQDAVDDFNDHLHRRRRGP